MKKKAMEVEKCMEETQKNILVLSENIAEAKVMFQVVPNVFNGIEIRALCRSSCNRFGPFSSRGGKC